MADPGFRPALIVVDMQEDFCPPNGSLAVTDARAITPLINNLLALPFAIRIATRDWHPPNHISFAANHPDATPFTSTATITNPYNSQESYETRLWPTHCVQDTSGASLIPELRADLVNAIIDKGTDPRVEMYSAFYDPFRNPRVSDSGLTAALKEAGVTHVYVVGLAGDYCVQSSAVDAASEGFVTYIVEEGTRCVDPESWSECKKRVEEKGVVVVSAEGPEVKRLYSGQSSS